MDYCWQKVCISGQRLLFRSIFFFCFSLLCYPWGYLFMGLLTFMAGEAPWCEFLLPHQHFHSNAEKQLLPNPMTYIGLMATSVCFSSSPVSIGWGGSVSGCWSLGVGSVMGWVQICSRSFLVSLRVETAWDSPAITGSYFKGLPSPNHLWACVIQRCGFS